MRLMLTEVSWWGIPTRGISARGIPVIFTKGKIQIVTTTPELFIDLILIHTKSCNNKVCYFTELEVVV
jgi:hypothetical protein